MISDFTKWQEVYTGVFYSSRDTCYRYPIPEIFPLINNPTNTLLVGCFSNSVKPNWKIAGWLHQIVPLPFKDSYLKENKCLLNKYNLIELSVSDISGFKISFQPVTWLDDLTLTISIFTQ